MQASLRIVVEGNVQGVGFRYTAMRQASALGICGCVRNLPDGSVEILARGEAHEMEEFLDWCRIGPGGASVDAVLTSPTTLECDGRFRILH